MALWDKIKLIFLPPPNFSLWYVSLRQGVDKPVFLSRAKRNFRFAG